jgi:tetratricopeptide (TPR) repeat protein/tRNA A-37 threonylcarbamoyl transferase component Bud32
MTCPRCGHAADDTARTCPACRAPLGVAADLEATDAGLAAAFDADATQLPAPRPARAAAPVAAAAAAATDDDDTHLGPVHPHLRARRPAPAAPAPGAAGDLVGRNLGPRYHLIKLLGAGGMGAVYQAWDEELGVAVALKTVRSEVAADPDTARMLERRFKQELLLARKVTHKNIVRVHDIGEVDGIKYITMPYVAGEDLSTILKREGKLPVPRVMRLARSILSGLAAAHEAGVVHRDLKPANIMVDAHGEGLVMDFGVARSTDGPSAAPGARDVSQLSGVTAQTMAQTMVGSVVGTVEYMAPEQARAESVDQRADIYAFGLILYDLLTGRIRARHLDSAVAELQQRMREAPKPLRAVDASIHPALEKIVMRCVQPETAARFETSRALEQELAKLDDDGAPLPLVRRLTWKGVTAAAVIVASLLGGTFWLARTPPAAPVAHEPVSILIADLKNDTGDAMFDGTLEPMLKLSLEGAGFISAYDRNGIRRSLGIVPPATIDENEGRSIAVKQGVGVVLSGAVTRDGTGYMVAIKAAESVTGKVIADASARAAGRDQVLGVAASLGDRVRAALGDDTSDSAQRFATDTLSATSLEVVREYADAMEALSNSQFDAARAAFGRATTRDPNFGLAYAGMAIASSNMGQPQEAEAYVKEAMRHVDRMTERERFRTRGLFYYLTNDYANCVKEYGDLLARYDADAAARNNLALCSTKLRNMGRARDEMRRVVQILPKRSLYRVNASLYSIYASNFADGEQEALVAQELGDRWAQQALALAKLGQGDLAAAAAAYERLAGVQGAGPSYTASGLGDIALYRGRFADAARIFGEGAAADLKAEDGDRAAAKLAAMAYTELSRGRMREARAAAEQALAHSNTVQIRFLAGRTLALAGAAPRAAAIAKALGSELQAEPQAYGGILWGLIVLEAGDSRQAVTLLTNANSLLDTWIGRFELGRAYLAAGAYAQADSEFDRCLKRSGEALSLFLDEEPTSGYLPSVYYYLGRAREGMGTSAFADAYRRYLAIRNQTDTDLLADDIRRRLRS